MHIGVFISRILIFMLKGKILEERIRTFLRNENMEKILLKIGILNLQQVDNFGCVLGAYAIQHVTQDISKAYVELIDYRPIQKKHNIVEKAMRAMKRSAVYGIVSTLKKHRSGIEFGKLIHQEGQKDRMSDPERIRKFKAFRNKYFRRSKPYTAIDKKHHPQYDVYLVGSDVVWLLDDLWMENSPAMLRFTDGMDCRRISYAASLGDFSVQIGRKMLVKRLYRHGLMRFDTVSVREETSASYLSSLYQGKIYCCMDPTLLLSLKDYEEIEHTSSASSPSGYIYVYMLDDTGDFYKAANEISRQTGLPLVRCCDQINGYENVAVEAEGDGPADFLSRIKNAELVITNSFHAVCFSLIYHKKFFVVRRNTQAYKTEELLKKLGLYERYLDMSNCNDMLKPIDFEAVDRKLNNWRRESEDYLKKALNGSDKV